MNYPTSFAVATGFIADLGRGVSDRGKSALLLKVQFLGLCDT